MAALSAQADGKNVFLSWQTDSESGNAGFFVQHQPPHSSTWKGLGFVESKASGGASAEAKSYRYAAQDLAVGMHRFRLKQVGLDDTTTFTESAVCRGADAGSASPYGPNSKSGVRPGGLRFCP